MLVFNELQITGTFRKNLNFYKSSSGPYDRARFSGKCNMQKIDPATGVVVSSWGNLTFVVDLFDGNVYTPAQKDLYGIKVFFSDSSLWWGSSSAVMDPLGGGGPGGVNINIFSTK